MSWNPNDSEDVEETITFADLEGATLIYYDGNDEKVVVEFQRNIYSLCSLSGCMDEIATRTINSLESDEPPVRISEWDEYPLIDATTGKRWVGFCDEDNGKQIAILEDDLCDLMEWL